MLAGQPSGRNFIVKFSEGLENEETSMTTEQTVQSKMDLAGLSEASMDCFLETIEEFESWNDTLNVKLPDQKLAFVYRTWVSNLGRHRGAGARHNRGREGQDSLGDLLRPQPIAPVP